MKKLDDYANKPFDYIINEEEVRTYTLPELLTSKQGEKITSADEWTKTRRPEILHDFAKYVYGAVPARFDGLEFHVKHECDFIPGRITLRTVEVKVKNQGKDFSFELYMYLPVEMKAPLRTFLLINNRFHPGQEMLSDNEFTPIRKIIDAGFAFAMFDCNFVATDKNKVLTPGIMELFPAETTAPEGFGVITAWVFAAMRCIDYFATVPELNPGGTIVVGHSRGGKAALWTGANDVRVAQACSNDSGCTGAAIARRKVGETIKDINNGFPHWFNENYKNFNDNEDALPVDQHMLAALIAPRFVHVGSAIDDIWADPKGEYLSLIHAAPAFRLFGRKGLPENSTPVLDKLLMGDGMAYHIRRGGHNLGALDWDMYISSALNNGVICQ
ncbi:MAG: hypothetical protein JXR78_17265 [Victivallales bacterium]|nr:hypothetical protein [Victivallales bacterium]